MAKVWKPKYWDATNPPVTGARVFVGKANGASSYESIAAGQTKRILQSNGRGNIFYGNVTAGYPPLEPALESNLPDGDYSGISSIASCLRPGTRMSSGNITTSSSSMIFRQYEPINFRKNKIQLDYSTSNKASYISVSKPYSIEVLKSQCNKLTLYIDASNYCVFEFKYTRNTDTSNATNIEFDIVFKAVMLNGTLDTNSSTMPRTWDGFTDKYNDATTAQLIFSKTQW